jgi:3-carboxy-cis,cis-muconate cycloisomerase
MEHIWSPQSLVRRMLAFEAALAHAEARAGVIPAAAAAEIEAACRGSLEWLDIDALFAAARGAGTPVIPLIEMLNEHLPEAVRGLPHWGATSQDTMDTALVLQMRDGINLLVGRLLATGAAASTLAEQHRHTLMAGRTLLQQALPITFGLKAARWLGLIARQVPRLQEVGRRVAYVQLGGAAGTLAALATAGERVTQLLAEELELAVPDMPWHAERDRVVEAATTLGVVAGAMAKIAADVVLLAQTEVGELAEAGDSGKGRSSALPQKRNPVDAIMALASSRLAVGQVPVLLGSLLQEHERAAGGWQAEWEAIPALFGFTMDAVDRVRSSLSGLQVEPGRMRANLAASGGLVMAESLTMALAPILGRDQALVLVRDVAGEARDRGLDLRAAALADERIMAVLSTPDLDTALDPANYLGSTDTYIDRALAGFAELLPPERTPPHGPLR